MKWLILMFILTLSLNALEDLKTVSQVDLNRYLGKWYEIARYPNPFQKKCLASTAEYSLDEKGRIIVLNTCYTAGKVKDIKGKAWVVKDSDNSKLKVSFFWPFKGDYWIIDLADDYSYVVVGEPKRKYIWILARTPLMNAALLADILQKFPEWGYSPDQLIYDEWQEFLR